MAKSKTKSAISFLQFWQKFIRTKSAKNHEKSSKSGKTTFLRVPQGPKISRQSQNRQKIRKSQSKTGQKMVKKWSKRVKSLQENGFLGVKKHGPGCQKVPFFVMGGGQNRQKLSKTDKSWKSCQKCTANWHGKIKSQVFIRFWQFWRKSKIQKCRESWKIIKKWQNDIFEGPPGSKNQQTVAKQAKNQKKSIKNWSKNGQKSPKKDQKSAGKCHFGGQKSMVLGAQKHQKVLFLDIGRVKSVKNWQILKIWSKSTAKS